MRRTWLCALTVLGSLICVPGAQAQPAAGGDPAVKKEAAETASGATARPGTETGGIEKSDAKSSVGKEGRPASPDVLKGVHGAAEKVVEAFNAGKATEVANLFLPDGEWVDEEGNAYQGRKSIEEILTKYFAKYPGAEIALEIDTVRVIGPLAIEEGVRTMSVGEDSRAFIEYVAILARTDAGWQYASVKDTSREMMLTAHAALEPLNWLVGEWINEGGSGSVVKINYRWSEDENFLIGEYVVESDGSVVMKSTHRIGWDPLHGNIRSWLFDSDGGIGEGVWVRLGESWHIDSNAIFPDGRPGSALVTLDAGGDRFTMRGTDRFIAGMPVPDFELNVVRRAPPAGRASQSQTQQPSQPAATTSRPVTPASPQPAVKPAPEER